MEQKKKSKYKLFHIEQKLRLTEIVCSRKKKKVQGTQEET